MAKSKNNNVTCSFCGRDKKDVNVLIAGITGHICDSCINQAENIIKEEFGSSNQKEIESSLKLLFMTQLF